MIHDIDCQFAFLLKGREFSSEQSTKKILLKRIVCFHYTDHLEKYFELTENAFFWRLVIVVVIRPFHKKTSEDKSKKESKDSVGIVSIDMNILNSIFFGNTYTQCTSRMFNTSIL